MKLARSAPDVGWPVNPVLGAKVLADEEDVDFTLPGPIPLEWQRSYNSQSMRAGWFGIGWASPLELALQVVADPGGRVVDHVDYFDAFGRRIEFPALAPGDAFFSPFEGLTLLRSADGRYGIDDGEGLRYWFDPRSDGRQRLSAISDPNDQAIHIDYAERAGVLHAAYVSCSGGQQLELMFADERLVDIVESRRLEDGRRESVALACYGYSAQRQLANVIDRAGQLVRRFEYDSDGRLTHQVHGDFEAWYAYAGQGKDSHVVTHWDNVGGQWTFVYYFDTRHRWSGLTDPLGRFTRRALDRHGNLRAIVDPAGNATEALFDERGNPVEIRDANGATTTIQWHERHAKPVTITDPVGATTVLAYDDRGNLVAETDATGATTRYGRDARGLATLITDANGGTKQFEYNQRAQVTRYVDCSGQPTTFDYDDNGWLVGVVDALGQRTSYEYDAAGRLVRHTLPDGSFEAYEFDVRGNLTAVTDALQRRTRFAYSPDGLLVFRIDALGHTVRYRHDAARRLAEVVNESGDSYRIEYDAADRTIGETRFDGSTIDYRYDDGDRVVEKIEGGGTADAIVTRFERDAAGQILARNAGRAHGRYAYDAAGRMIHAQQDEIRVALEYDRAGQIVAETVTTPLRSFKVSHAYDLLGNRLHSMLPDGTKVASLFYGSGHVHQIRVNDAPITDIERDALHREVARTQGALSTARSYDPAGRLRSLLTSPRSPAGQRPGLDRCTRIEREFRYDQGGRLAWVLDRGREHHITHDALDRLTRYDEERFAFDPAHHLIATGEQPSGSRGRVEGGRVVVLEDKRFAYDAHGRLVDKRIGSHTAIELQWSEFHRLRRSVTRKAGQATTVEYLYDPFGRRIAKTCGDATTWYVWAEDQLIQEVDQQASHTFVYEPDSFTPLALYSHAHAMVDRPPGPSEAVHYCHCDQIGLPRELTDVDGVVRWQVEYRAWGAIATETVCAAGVALPQPVQRLRFEGQYHDPETGLHYNRFRYYDPDLAAYVAPDPIGLEGGENLYEYAPSPLDWIDPLGLFKRRRRNGQFAAKPGPKKQKDTSHGCSLETTKKAQVYELRDRDTGEVQKFGETTVGRGRYTQAFLDTENVDMVFIGRKRSKRQARAWETRKIRAYKKQHGCRPRLNKSDH